MQKSQLKLDEIWLYRRTSSSRVSHLRSRPAALMDHDSDEEPSIVILEETSNQVQREKEKLITASVFLCQQGMAFDTLKPLFILYESLSIRTLSVGASAIESSSNEAIICALEHVAQCLHAELIAKVKASSVVGKISLSIVLLSLHVILVLEGWILNAARSKADEELYIVYVRYLENLELKTSYYGLFNLPQTATAKEMAIGLINLWEKDRLKPVHSCWLATDNVSLVTGQLRASRSDEVRQSEENIPRCQ